MTGTSIAHYQIGEKLGAGGMGEVYRATDTKLGREVALKILPEQFATDEQRMARFQREAQLLASLSHSNVGAIYGLEEEDGTRAIVLELIEGETLAEHIQRGPMPVDRALKLALQIAEALEAAHEKGITHRDLKPANVKITPEGQVKVLDFGLAKAAAPEPGSSPDMTQSPTLTMAATQAGIILGTAAYMSPEQAQALPADRRADIWAWGVVLFEMLTGRKVFEGENTSMVMAHVLSREPDWERLPSDLPRRIRDLLEHCLRKDPASRLQAIGDARVAIQDYFADPEEAEQTPAAVSARTSWVPWLMVATLAALAIVLAGLLISRPEAPRQAFRFALPAVEGDIAPLHFALSPDGRSIVQATQEGLWLRRLDDAEGRLLPYAGGFPFWSPDSQWIGFLSNGLKKARVDGGPPQTLCAVSGFFFGATWGEDNVILFSQLDEGNPALFRLAASGGEPVRLDYQVEGYRGLTWPHFLPGSDRFLFLATNQGAATGGQILAASLDDLSVTPLVASDFRARFDPSGHLLFLRESTLMAQAFDPSSLSTKGEAFPIAEEIMTDGPIRMSAFDGSATGLLVYRGGQPQNYGLKWFDRNGASGEAHSERYSANPRPNLSADNRRVVLQKGEPTDIWVVDLLRSTSTRVTFEETIETYPVFSPDGARFVYASEDDLYVKSAGGAGQAELLLDLDDAAVATDWSADGRYVLFTRIGSERSLWAIPVEGERTPIQIADVPFDMRHGKFSPDGRWVAYASGETGSPQIYLVPFPGTGRQGKWQVSADGGAQPVWGPDGKEIFFLSPDLGLMAVDVTLADEPEIGVPRKLFDVAGLPGNTDRYSVSSSGTQFLFATFLNAESGLAPIAVETDWLGLRGIR